MAFMCEKDYFLPGAAASADLESLSHTDHIMEGKKRSFLGMFQLWIPFGMPWFEDVWGRKRSRSAAAWFRATKSNFSSYLITVSQMCIFGEAQLGGGFSGNCFGIENQNLMSCPTTAKNI